VEDWCHPLQAGKDGPQLHHKRLKTMNRVQRVGDNHGGIWHDGVVRSNPPLWPTIADNRLDRLGTLIPAISARILTTSSEHLDTVICDALQEALQAVELDRVALLEVAEASCRVLVSHLRSTEERPIVSPEVNLAQMLPWTYHQLVALGRPVAKYGLDSIPEEAVADRQAFVQMGIKSALAVPLMLGQRVHHIIVVHAVRETRIWTESFLVHLRLLGEILVSALERRDMLRSLEIVQTRLDVAAASAGVGLWEYDLATGEIWATSRVRELLHFDQHQPLTLNHFLDNIHPEDRSFVVEAIAQTQHPDKKVDIEYRVPEPDGSVRWLVSRGRIHGNGTEIPISLTGVTMDITRRKTMEQALQEQVREIERLREQLEQENTLLRSEAGLDEEKHRPLGGSAAMQGVQVLIDQVAVTDSTVLIQGETGTGKELIAQTIHQCSNRSKRLMVTVNCAALPSGLIESELFGREKGAFTGALSRQAGRFELADGSTLFLDEIAEMPLETQAKLLRVIQDGTFERLGSPTKIKVDVRIIAATNRHLAEEVEKGRFRADLFYRLNVFPLYVPPLRERTDDIPMLVWKFIGEFGQKMGRKVSRIASDDLEKLTAYSWPGNVRELRNVVERAMIASTGNVLDVSQVHLSPSCAVAPSILPLEEIERQHIQKTLHFTQGKIKGKGGAAELLGLHPSTLYSRMRKLAVKFDPVSP
jgi:transcriptional regulator with GAF, ATPase, and Fis domain